MSYERNGQSAQTGAYTPEQVAAVRAYLEGLGHQVPDTGAPRLPTVQEDPLIRLQRTNRRLEQENALLRVSMELLALQNEGVELDPQAEAPLLTSMDDNARAMRYAHMRRYYRNRNERAGAGPGLPQIPGAAPGVPAPVPLQYQRHGETPTTPAAEAPATFEEREAIYAVMLEEQAGGRSPDYGEALRLVRYGRRRNGVPATTGERTY